MAPSSPSLAASHLKSSLRPPHIPAAMSPCNEQARSRSLRSSPKGERSRISRGALLQDPSNVFWLRGMFSNLAALSARIAATAAACAVVVRQVLHQSVEPMQKSSRKPQLLQEIAQAGEPDHCHEDLAPQPVLTPVFKLRSLNVLCPAYKRTPYGREEDNEDDWRARLEDLLNLPQLWDGDIISLQEVFLASEEYVNQIVTRHAREFAFYGYQREYDRQTHRADGLLIGLRKDIEVVYKKEIDFEDVAGKCALLLHVRRGTHEFIIVTTHLLFPHTKSANIIRLRQACKILTAVEEFRRDYAPDVPAVITGDFNGEPHGKVGRLMLASGWRSSYACSNGTWDRLITHKTHLGDLTFCDYLWLQDAEAREPPPYWPNVVFSEIVNRFHDKYGCKNAISAWEKFESLMGKRADYIERTGFRILLDTLGFFGKGQPQLTEAEVVRMIDGLDGNQNGRIEKREWEASWGRAIEVRKLLDNLNPSTSQCQSPYVFTDALVHPPELADGEWPDHYTVSDHGVVSATLAAQETEPQESGGIVTKDGVVVQMPCLPSVEGTNPLCGKKIRGQAGSFGKECLADERIVELLRSSREDCTVAPWKCAPECRKAEACRKISRFVQERASLDYGYHTNVCYARQVVQDQILHTCLPTVPIQTNWVILLAGAIGVGKTHVRKILCEKFPRLSGFVTVDYDELRSRLPEWEPLLDQEKFSADAPKTAPVKTQGEARLLGELLERHAFRRGWGLLIDGSFQNAEWWSQQIREMQSAGFMPNSGPYKVALFYVYGAGKDTLEQRIYDREMTEKRGVLVDVVDQSAQNTPKAVACLKEVVDLYTEFNNSADSISSQNIAASCTVVRCDPHDERGCFISPDMEACHGEITTEGSLGRCISPGYARVCPSDGNELQEVARMVGFA